MRKFAIIIILSLIISLGSWIQLDPEAYAQGRNAGQYSKTVEFIGKKLFVKGKEFPVKGAVESGYPISTFHGQMPPPALNYCLYDAAHGQYDCPGLENYDIQHIWDQEAALIASLGGNTLRTFNKITPSSGSPHNYSTVLKAAKEHNIWVIGGYYPAWGDYTNDNHRQAIITDFLNYQAALKADPNYDRFLLNGLGNEHNYHFCKTVSNCTSDADNKRQAKAYYSLMDDLAALGKMGDPDPRPFIIIEGDLGYIGDHGVATDDLLPHIDAWATNVYRGNTFYDLFTDYATRSDKPFILAEFGVDVYNNNTGGLYLNVQADWINQLWNELVTEYKKPKGFVAGGLVYQIADRWFDQPWTPSVVTHDPGGWSPAPFPDNIADEEYWGLFERVPGKELFDDEFNERPAAQVTRGWMNLLQ